MRATQGDKMPVFVKFYSSKLVKPSILEEFLAAWGENCGTYIQGMIMGIKEGFAELPNFLSHIAKSHRCNLNFRIIVEVRVVHQGKVELRIAIDAENLKFEITADKRYFASGRRHERLQYLEINHKFDFSGDRKNAFIIAKRNTYKAAKELSDDIMSSKTDSSRILMSRFVHVARIMAKHYVAEEWTTGDSFQFYSD